ncbi:MAG: methylmalonyl-CoA epimerase [Bacteroidia bacterium]
MFKKIEHVGIAVSNAGEANELFRRLFGKAHYKAEQVDSENVITSFFGLGDTKVELLATTEKSGPIGKFIEKRGQGIHHIAFEVDDIHAEISRLKEEGFDFISEIPKDGADNKLICFLHPKSTNGVLVELCQSKLSNS